MPIRMCLGCRARQEQQLLLRVVAVNGQAVFDTRRRLPGRGAWVHPDAACVTRSLRSLTRALRLTHLDMSPVADWAATLVNSDHDREIDRPMDN